MNANEMADLMTGCPVKSYTQGDITLDFHEIAAMLRQQQGEIAQLKHINKNWQISENILLLELEKLQHRELTDEEIKQVMVSAIEEQSRQPFKDIWQVFARAILRKAQEK